MEKKVTVDELSTLSKVKSQRKQPTLTVLLSVGDDLVALPVGLVAVHGDLQRVHVGRLVFYHLAEEHPGRACLVRVLVIHRVLLAVVLAVLGQHFREDNVSLIPV